MGFSEIVYANMFMNDICPPGAPEISLVRAANREIEVKAILPMNDYNGEPLSGMSELIIAICKSTNGTDNPFAGVEAADLISFAESNAGKSTVVFISDSDAGALKTARFSDLELKVTYWVAATVKDA